MNQNVCGRRRLGLLLKNHSLYSGGSLKNYQTLVTITSVKAQILKVIPENETGGSDLDLLSPTFPPLFPYRLPVVPLVPSPNFLVTFVCVFRRRSNPKVICPFWLSLQEQHCTKINCLCKKIILFSAINKVSSGSLGLVWFQWVNFKVHLTFLVLKAVTLLFMFNSYPTNVENRVSS